MYIDLQDIRSTIKNQVFRIQNIYLKYNVTVSDLVRHYRLSANTVNYSNLLT